MAKVIWDPDAEQDLRDIAHFIGVERHSPQAARKFIDSIREKCDLYATQPEIGEARPDLEPDMRAFPIRSYIVFYFPLPNGIYVARVLEGHRDYAALFRRP